MASNNIDPTSSYSHHQVKRWSSLSELCDLLHIATSSAIAEDRVQFQHVQFKPGQRIHTAGQTFDMLYLVHSGFLKTVLIDEFGNEQVLGFPMKGDLLGIDGIHKKQYATDNVALSDCDVILVPFKTLTALGRAYPELEALIYGVMSRDLLREQSMLGSLGALSAESRIARFLIFLSERYRQLGYSGKQLNLRMTREDIGSYLGLTLSTVSRALSEFNAIGFISVDQRSVVIHDIAALRVQQRLSPLRARAEREAAKAMKRAFLSSVAELATLRH